MDIPVIIVYALLIAGGTLPFVFRRQLWLRGLCVTFILFASLFAVGRVYVSPRMAVDRFHAENKVWTESFRDGSLYTYRAALTALPIFILAVGSLVAMVVFPPKTR